MDHISSFLLTCAIIFFPPMGLRVIRGTAFSKTWAIAIAFLLFFANHIIFAIITNQQNLRLFLTLGALVTFVVLRWHTNASAEVLIAAQRRALGYSIETPDSSTDSPIQVATVTPRIASNLAFSSPTDKRGWIRVWIVITVCWLLLVAGRLGYELLGETTSRVLSYQIEHAPTLSVSDLDRFERNLRQAIEGEMEKSAPPVSAGNASSYASIDQYLDEVAKSLNAKVLNLLPSEFAPLTTQQAMDLAKKTELPQDKVLLAPFEAQRLNALIQLRSTIGHSPILRSQVLGYRPPSYEPRIILITLVALSPPIAFILIWVILTWIARGFRSYP